ncbi:UvrD-helicase domain-containing protein [Desulfonatronovibrio hydrogenovorans]|uniref:UvrD-helicase domain-containing protein n=1 Tax=Desulfonatronovibrio hydrogenovorans TaxID=53245 RepID=UPI000490F0CC|nr:UvrD-helicase domain-containing protein [Desulfonatronovibrio hydrogenovorans]
MANHTPNDYLQREQALDPARSFIVQAPAGSGKTELLTQRFLRLLSRVNDPEEILAITFTRKAAAEMRNRVVNSLIRAGSEPEPSQPHAAKTWQLAAGALSRDQKMGWNILDNPARLKIRTIDSFCLHLAGRMPLFSGAGTDLKVAEKPETLYEEAARNTLLELKKDSPWHESLSRVLLHLDNDWNKTRELIITMLKLREHWLRLLSPISSDQDLRTLLEGHLKLEIQRRLEQAKRLLAARLSPELQSGLLECARYAASNLIQEMPDSPIIALADMDCLPQGHLRDLGKWLGLQELLTTRSSRTWRRTVNKNTGFPSGASFKDASLKKRAAQNKEMICSILETLSQDPGLEQSIAWLSDLPETGYSDQTWLTVSALLRVLKMAAAQLHLVMHQNGTVDYPEVSRAALNALGHADAPSELLLRLDFQVKHVLFDEFQDTSITQHQMLTMLTSGWTRDDGRTLFAVGDPMQSIYAFRDADVGVFLNTRQNSIGEILLEPIQLKVNFRSSPAVVEWVNQVFPAVFQDLEDHVRGSVTYSAMSAAKDDGGLVQVHPFVDPRTGDEAAKVLEIIRQTSKAHPDEDIAVLVRTRNHLQEIVRELRQRRIPFQAVEIESLGDKRIVADLLALTRALLRPNDRLSWLAVLRAPWAGLDLKDLSRLSQPHDQTAILERIIRLDEVRKLSPDGLDRLDRVRKVLIPAWENRLRKPLSTLVQGIWHALGGPACIRTDQELENAESFFNHLEWFQENYTIEDLSALENSLQGLYSLPDPQAGDRLKVMTIHKAKGLEFDTVIIPGLEKTTGSSGKLLLQFMEVAGQNDGDLPRLFLAPIAAPGGEHLPTYRFIEGLKKDRDQNETGRLMYVAATRAVKRLHLLGSVATGSSARAKTAIRTPPKSSMLWTMWDSLQDLFQNELPSRTGEEALPGTDSPAKHNRLTRLASSWVMPEVPGFGYPHAQPVRLDNPEEPVTYHWAGDTARHIGTAVHNLLRIISEQGLDAWPLKGIEAQMTFIERLLLDLGVSNQDLELASGKVLQAVKNTLTHPLGRWILDSHNHARSEYDISAFIDGQNTRVILDRTFIDQDDVRWIIDFKTSIHEGGGLDEFLDREMDRYRPQILKYMRIMKVMDHRPVRAGLFFPLLTSWREIRE